MANADRPKGFEPSGRVKQSMSAVSGAAIFPGDFVHLEADGLVDPAVAGEDIYGLCISRATAASQRIMLSVDPSQIYIGQASATEVNLQDDIGNVCNILATAGNSTYKTSRQEVDSSTIGTSNNQLVLLDIERRVDNAFGAQVDVRVKITENQIFGETDFAGI